MNCTMTGLPGYATVMLDKPEALKAIDRLTEPCKACNPACPQHRRQRIVVRPDGVRVQICERCSKVIAVLGKLKLVEMD